MPSFADRLRGWLGLRRAPAAPPDATPPAPPPPATASATPPPPPQPTRDPPPSKAVPDADGYLPLDDELDQLLGLRPPEFEPTEEVQLEILTELVQQHISSDRPELVSFPAIAMKVVSLVEERDVSIDRLASTIAQDAAVSAALLRVANSAYYSRGVEITNVRHAITHIGLSTVANLAAGIAGRSLYDVELAAEYEHYRQRWDDLFHRSMTVAFTSGALAMLLRRGGSDRAFAGGLFHDVGKTMVLRSMTALVLGHKLEFEPSARIIDRLLDRLHLPLGVEMAKAWKLPDYIVRIVARHHELDLPMEDDIAEVHIVRLVSALNALRIAPDLGSPLATEIRHSIKALGIDKTQFLRISAELRDFAQKVTKIFGVKDSVDQTLDAPTEPGILA